MRGDDPGGQDGACVVFGGSRKKDMVDFMGSQPQLEHDRLLGSVPVRFGVFFAQCGGDAGLKDEPVTAWAQLL